MDDPRDDPRDDPYRCPKRLTLYITQEMTPIDGPRELQLKIKPNELHGKIKLFIARTKMPIYIGSLMQR